VLGHGIFSRYQELETSGLNIEALWSYSARCAAIARNLATKEQMDATAVDMAFMSGMLQDVGKLVLASEKAEEYAEILRRVGGQNGFSDEVEAEVLGATHGEVGAYLLGLWGLPDAIEETVAYHETPGRCHDADFGVLGVVHVASRLALNPGATDPADPSLHVDLEYLQTAGVIDRWPIWQAGCEGSLEEEEQAVT
jgi:HD-like signal output (HDOD) protein